MATQPATTQPPGAAIDRALELSRRIPWPAVLRLLLGALFVSTFYENLEKKLYTVPGYSGLIDDYAARNHAPGFWSDHFMKFISDHASFFAPVQAVFELSLGVLLVLGIA